MLKFEVKNRIETIVERTNERTSFASERKKDANFECEVEPTSTSYAAFEYMSTADEAYDPYAGLNIDLCLEVDAIDLNQGSNSNQSVQDDYDPYEVFMRMNTRRTVTGRDRAPLAVLPSHGTTPPTPSNNYRNYNFADDDTPVKYPLAIGHIDRRPKPQPNVRLLHRSIDANIRFYFRFAVDTHLDRRLLKTIVVLERRWDRHDRWFQRLAIAMPIVKHRI